MAEAPIVAVLDACVLAGSVPRHLLLSFAEAGLCAPVWSDRILRETERAIPKTFANAAAPPEDAAAHAGTVCQLMVEVFPCAIPETQIAPERLPDLPDPDDRHVVETALASSAGYIVTDNLKDFPKSALQPLGITAISADRFLAQLAEDQPKETRACCNQLIARVHAPDFDFQAFTDRLKTLGFRRFRQIVSS